nr:helix-turn-helix transcriptional regulator [Streptomyces malaysiense]
MAGRPERPLDPGEGPLQRLAYELRKLRGEAGNPTYRRMAALTGAGASTLSQAAAGERLPTLPTVLAYVRACDGDVAEWERRWRLTAREIAAEPRADQDGAEPPYRGMRRFEPGDADLFFGRTALTAQLAATVGRQRLVAVVGASGSGKSSLLRAGLVPALRAPDVPGGRPAAVRILTPGPRPTSHARAFEPAAGEGTPSSWSTSSRNCSPWARTPASAARSSASCWRRARRAAGCGW